MKKLSAILLLLVTTCCSAQQVTLALNLKKDSIYYLNTNATVNGEQIIQGTTQILKSSISGKISHKVISITDTLYEMEVRYKNLGMQMDVAGQSISFSTDKKDDMVSTLIATIVDKPFLMTISKSGRIIVLKNLENLFAGMFDNFPQLTEEQKVQLKTQFQESFGEKQFRSSFQDIFVIYPQQALSLNSKWVNDTELVATGLTVKTKMTFTLTDITNNGYKLSGVATLSSDNNVGYNETGDGIFMRYINATGTTTADVKIDKVTGWVVESKVVKKINGILQIKDGPKTPGGGQFPMSLTATILGKN